MNYKWVKKQLSLLCAGVLSISFLLTGCGASSGSSASASSQKESSSAAETSSEDTDKADPKNAASSSSSADSENRSSAEEASVSSESAASSDSDAADSNAASEKLAEAPELPGLTCESVMDLVYAESFDVYYYSGGYKLIDVKDDRRYLVVPEDSEAPEGISEDIVVLQQPLDTIYLAASSAMALFNAMDALDSIRMSGIQESGWYIDAAAEAMKEGKILFAGKYSKPDYEMLISEGCNLAIESTMILHSPKVQEMIEDLGIPVFIDRSSYESHPLGRTEWVKCYSALCNKEKEAEDFFSKELKTIEKLHEFENTGKTVAYFHINTEGQAVVRTSADYIPKMIDMAGGSYVFSDLKQADDSRSTSMGISMEEFYAAAKDADYLIYNASIDGVLGSTDDLIAKDGLFKDFKAVKEGSVWTTGKSLYQATDTVGEFILDLHEMLTSGDESQMRFLNKVK